MAKNVPVAEVLKMLKQTRNDLLSAVKKLHAYEVQFTKTAKINESVREVMKSEIKTYREALEKLRKALG